MIGKTVDPTRDYELKRLREERERIERRMYSDTMRLRQVHVEIAEIVTVQAEAASQ